MSEGTHETMVDREIDRSHMQVSDEVAIEITGMNKWYGTFHVLRDINLTVNRGERIVIAGPSGSGKSTLIRCINRLEEHQEGSIVVDGTELTSDLKNIDKIRSEVGMCFQHFNLFPHLTILENCTLAPIWVRKVPRKEAEETAMHFLEKVKIPDAKERMYAYPFQLSGGMQQRVMIAMAMMLDPDLIIADEPTTALDVTIQARIFALIKGMRREKTSILLITHDMGVIWEMCDRVIVMYASRIAEEAGKKDIFAKPAHPYTRGLLKSIPKLTTNTPRLEAIPGQVPSPYNYPSGCHFRDRCPHAFEKCTQELPPLMKVDKGHRAACWIADRLIDRQDG